MHSCIQPYRLSKLETLWSWEAYRVVFNLKFHRNCSIFSTRKLSFLANTFWIVNAERVLAYKDALFHETVRMERERKKRQKRFNFLPWEIQSSRFLLKLVYEMLGSPRKLRFLVMRKSDQRQRPEPTAWQVRRWFAGVFSCSVPSSP